MILEDCPQCGEIAAVPRGPSLACLNCGWAEAPSPPPPLVWGDEPPTEPGWWWWRLSVEGDGMPVLIILAGGCLKARLGAWVHPTADMLGQWAGPQSAPVEPTP